MVVHQLARRYTIVISQATKHQRGAMLTEYLDQLRHMFPEVDVVLYDDLIRRAASRGSRTRASASEKSTSNTSGTRHCL